MECFRQLFQCFKAPFTRSETRIIEIGPPTDFRKEELPACFSDAESVVSPNQNTTEPPILTSQSQHLDVSGQPRAEEQERSDSRTGDSSAVRQVKPSSVGEHRSVACRLRNRIKPLRWFNSTSAANVEKEVAELKELATMAGKG